MATAQALLTRLARIFEILLSGRHARASKNGIYHQVAFGFLPDKSGASYEKFWSAIQGLCHDLCDGHFSPKILLLDFEIAAINAAKCIFPDIVIKCCSFHLGQNWFKNIASGVLSKEFNNKDSETGRWMKLFFALPFLPSTDVSEAFLELMSTKPGKV